MKRNQSELIAQLKLQNLFFKNFSLIQEGEFTPSDADWNYKDVPHLHYVHQLVEAVIARVGDDEIATINIQKIFGIAVPLAVVNYQSGHHRQTYFTTFGPFCLIIESCYEELAPLKTRVTTTYSVGATRLWLLLFPLIRWTLKRNYKDLMSTDIPMRSRRGQLRKWGYQFRKADTYYSFKKTMNVMEANVVPPAGIGAAAETRIDLREVLPKDGVYLFGKNDHLGLQLVRKGSRVSLFPRMCPHEGANLDGEFCSEQVRLKCRWHGRTFQSCAQFEVGQDVVLETPYYKIQCADTVLTFRQKELRSDVFAKQGEVESLGVKCEKEAEHFV